MSFLDTLNGARKEVDENREQTKKSEEIHEEDIKDESTGFEKKSLTRAKPVREAAAGVRVVSSSGKSKRGKTAMKPKSEMTKEEKRAARQKQRDEDDRRTMASQALLRKDPVYQKYHKISVAMIAAGLGCTALSWIIVLLVPQSQTDMGSFWGIMAMVTLVVAYIGVIGGFLMDWVRLHKLRNSYNDRVRGMRDKQLNAIINEDRRELASQPTFLDRFFKKKDKAE